MHGGLLRFRDRLVRRPFAARDAGLVACLVIAGVLVFASHTNAAFPGTADVLEFIVIAVGTILGIIIAFMGKLIILLVSILISFASYNNFVHAQPVEIGWVLMRDVANMFFIVILLVSAFSTIIGYSEFHYSKVLPKLLLMAVLINFSKTLIGLLIDFSQVLMLTFVNAFRQAAGGNFVSALKLSKVTSLDPNASETYEVDSSLIPASILGIVMLGIAMTLLVIMIGFFIFRIIGLWLLLIMSPMAFFALALPGKLAKALTAFTDSFWSRLSTLLIGGPVMAFFLWLALAVVQGSDQPFGDLYTPTGESESASANFVTRVGTAPEIASFIVAVALMLSGLEFAVKTASAVSSTLGKFASTAAAGGGVAVALSRGAARVGARAGRVGFEGVDRFTDIRGKVGRAGLAVSAATGGIGAATFAGMAATRPKRERAAGAAAVSAAADLDPKTREGFLRRLSAGTGPAGTAAQMALAEHATSSLGIKSRTKAFAEEAEKMTNLKTPEEKKAWAEAQAHNLAAMDIKAGKAAAERLGDDAKLDKYKEAIKKNPALGMDWTDFAGIKNSTVEDPKKYLQGVSADSVKDSRAFLAHAAAMGLVDQETGQFIENDENKDTWDKFIKGNRGKYAEEHIRNLKAEEIKAQLKAMDGDAGSIAVANASRRFASDDKGRIASVFVNQGAPQVSVAQTFAVRNEAAIEGQKKRLTEFSRQGVADNSDRVVAAKTAMAGAGATLAEAFKYNPAQGTFEDNDNRDAFESAMSKLDEDLKGGKGEAFELLGRFDTASLASNPGAYNEARAVAASHLSTDALRKAYQQAVDSGNKEAQSRLGELTDVISREGKRIQNIAKKAKISTEEIIEVSQNPTSARSKDIAVRMEGAGIVSPIRSAQAADKAIAIEASPQLRAMRQKVAGRAVQATALKTGKTLGQKRQEDREARAARAAQKMEKKLGGNEPGTV